MRMIFKAVAILCLALLPCLPSAGRAQWIKDGVPIATAANSQSETNIISDGAGGAYIVWRDYRNLGNADIYMQRIDSYGFPLWAEGGVAVAEGPSQQGAPVMCMSDWGNVVVAYRDNVNGNDDIYAQCVDPDGNILWAAAGMPVCLHSSYQGYPHIVASTSGNAIIGWTDSRNGNLDVFAQRINSSGARQWTADGVVICNATNLQDEIEMVADGSSGAIFVWEDLRDGVNLLLYAQKITWTASLAWTANGVRLSSANCWQYVTQIIADGSGGAMVAWYDDRYDVDTDIFIQHIMTGGNVIWTSAGKYVCLENGDQYFPALTTDGAGGAIITWQDHRVPTYYHVYAQRVNASGDAQWGIGGYPVSDDTGGQRAPCIVSDGAGGAIIAWQDQRQGGEYDIHAQRIDGTGSKQWINEGERICGAIRSQSTARIATDGAQGAIITWTDLRDEVTTNYDVYAQRVEKCGNWGYPAPTITGGADVPNDQGGVVLLTWEPSYLDAYPEQTVTRYSIWRSTDGFTFTQIDSMDAYYLDSYQYAAATTADSSALGEATHWFKIRARTFNSSCWWTSLPFSCHSVDNFAPSAPGDLMAEWSHEPEGIKLSWAPVSDGDIACYGVYRGTSGDFLPCAENLLASPAEAFYVDREWSGACGYFYKVSSIDRNGNESGFAMLAPGEVADGDNPGIPVATYLSQNFPNPFNPATTIRFGLNAPADVSLRIYDAAGRLVRVLLDESRAAGAYAEQWDGMTGNGTRAASGVYFYMLSAGEFVETRKMILLK